MTSNPAPEIVLLNESGCDIPVSDADITAITDAVCTGEKVSFHLIEVVFVDEQQISELNKRYLGKEYVTDIITFPYSPADQTSDIEVTLTCCARRIDDQAQELGTNRRSEYCRVIIHGLLHVSGYDDQSENDSVIMKNREDYYLDLLNLD
ncbi:MAG: rRNA maturation RNase YbeY [Cyclonatronaceae bacterium]